MAAPVSTPAWLLQPEAGLCPCGCIGRRRRESFVAKTIAGVGGVLQAALFSEDVARVPGLLQRLDARVKVLALVTLLVAVGLVHDLALLVVAYLATVALARASALGVGFFVRRVWLFIPIFTGVSAGAINIAVQHPREFKLVESWSGYEQADPIRAIFGTDRTRIAANSPAVTIPDVASTLRAEKVRFWFYTGTEDTHFRAQNVAFASELSSLGISHRFYVVRGGHNWAIWRGNAAKAYLAFSRGIGAA